MIDFLKANPYVTREEYEWKWTVPQIKLALFDYTHIEYNYKNNRDNDDKNGNTVVLKNYDDYLKFKGGK